MCHVFFAAPCCFKRYFARWILNIWPRRLELKKETAEVKYSSRKITLKTARDGDKTWHMTQLTFSSNFHWKICVKFCILEQIISTVLFVCISSINNKRSLLRFQSTTAATNRGWSASGAIFAYSILFFDRGWANKSSVSSQLLISATYLSSPLSWNFHQPARG